MRVEVNIYFFRVYLFVEGPMSRVEGNIFFSGFVFFTLCCRLDFRRLVESGLHVPARFSLMSANMIALHITNVCATARKIIHVTCSIQISL